MCFRFTAIIIEFSTSLINNSLSQGFSNGCLLKVQRKEIHSGIHRGIGKYAYLVLLIPIVLVSYPILATGLIINGDFPVLDTGEFASDKLSTWVANGSYPTVETLPRFPIISFWYLLNNVGIDAEVGGKIMIILGFSVGSFSFYFSFVKLMRDRIGKYNNSLQIAAIVGAIIYAYNVWSFIRIGHWYLWIGYVLLPLFLLAIINSNSQGHSRRWVYVLLSVSLWSIASSTPHMAVFYGIIYIVIFSIYFLRYYFTKRSLFELCVPFLSIILLFILVNFYWLYPLFLSGTQEKLSPPYVLTEEMGKILSRNSSMLNSIRMIADWTGLEKLEIPSDTPLYPLWVFSSFVVPIVAITALLVKRALPYSIIFLAILVFGMLLAMGEQSPIDYYSHIFVIPFGWLFRDPDKWSFLIALAQSFLVGISINAILQIRPCRRKLINYATICGVISIIVVFFAIYAYPIYDSTLGRDGKYSPITIPAEFYSLNSYLSNIDTDKIFFMPYPVTSTTWSNGHLVGNIYPTFSVKPNIMVGNPGVSDPNTGNYYRYLESAIMTNRSDNIEDLLYPFGTSYIVFHNDTDDLLFKDSHTTLLSKLNLSAGVEKLSDLGIFKLFKVGGNSQEPKQIDILGRSIVAVQGLDKLTSLSSISSFNSLDSSLLFLDYPTTEKERLLRVNDLLLPTRNADDLTFSLVDDRYIISPYEVTTHYSPSTIWSKAGTSDPLHGEFHPYLKQIGIENLEFDYGKGIVMTEAVGAKLDIPFTVDEGGSYEIAMRYMANQKGGELRLSLDGTSLDEINTRDDRSNRFVWINLGSNVSLVEGHHTLSLENVAGFNAVNVFAVLPTDKKDELMDNVHEQSSKMGIVYVLEAESNFSVKDKPFDVTSKKSEVIGPEVIGGFSGFSNGTVLVISPGSEISTELDVIKPSNYTLALRTKLCESCSPMNIDIEDETGNDINISSNISTRRDINISSGMEWQYLKDIDLDAGRYVFNISSELPRELDLVLLYSSDRNQTDTVDDLFVNPQAPAYVQESDMIEPAKSSIRISNATRPYILSFAETFSSSWSAVIEKNNSSTTIKSLPLYSMRNGFYIDELGNYTVKIVDENETSFSFGVLISIITIIAYMIALLALVFLVPRKLHHFNNRNVS
jgi:hypothetical protein